MRSIPAACGLAITALVTMGGCGNPPSPVQASGVMPEPSAAAAPERASIRAEPGGRRILLLDECDPGSFNENVGPGTCVNRRGGVSFENFIALLTRLQRVPSWRFAPDTITVPRDATLALVNAGGEVHTFTEVEAFGGGIVPALNDLAGTPAPAPECLALAPSDFLAPGAETTHSFEPGEEEKYQCCIHPWMRAVAR